MGLWQRFSMIFKSKASKALDRAEDPRQTLDYSYERQLEMLTKVRRGVADVATSRKRVEMQITQLESQSSKLTGQAQKAIEVGREDLAREALTRKSGLNGQLTDLKEQHAQLQGEEEKLTRASQQLQAKVDAFRTRKETIKATYTAAEAQTKINEAFSGISTEMGDVGQAIQRAEDKTAQMQARAGAIEELLASGALDTPATLGGGDDISRELEAMSSAVRRRARARRAQGRHDPRGPARRLRRRGPRRRVGRRGRPEVHPARRAAGTRAADPTGRLTADTDKEHTTMARTRTRFAPDRGLTLRMTTVMFLLGALFVAFMVVLMWIAIQAGFGGLVPVIALIGLGIAWYQWYFSDKAALRAMRARVVTPEQAPELHGMIDRLCALADMPKPMVAIADTALPNAFATGRSPQRSAVCVTTGILKTLGAEELEGVLAHELSHVAHRDVLVMTVASSAGVIAGMITQVGQYGLFFGGGRSDDDGDEGIGGFAALMVALVVSLVVYAISFVLTRMLSRYRELCADRSGALLTQRPQALASALLKISGEMSVLPKKDLREVSALNAFFIAPAVAGTPCAR